MHVIKVSDTVWNEIAAKGKFGEVEDDVLRRLFRLPARKEEANVSQSNGSVSKSPAQRQSFATDRMSSYIARGQLHVSFRSGASQSWDLPDKNDKLKLRSVRNNAIAFAREHAATVGQVNAVIKTLTNDGYHLTK
jgi:negative regulator of replication initiation